VTVHVNDQRCDSVGQLRLGLVGAGGVAALHVDAALELSDLVRITAVADPRLEAARKLAARCAAVPLHDHQELAASGLVDAVVVASPHHKHCEQVVDLAAAGLPILVEKPMALSVADCERMIRAAGAGGVPLAVGHLQRYLPTVGAAGRLLAEGRIGRPRMFLERRSVRYEPGTHPAWFFDPDAAGEGGILTNIGAHCMDKLFLFTGSRIARPTSAWTSGDAVATDVAVTLDLADDAHATIVLTGTGLPESEVSEVVGSAGAMRISRVDGISVFVRGEVVHRVPAAADEVPRAFVAQLADFRAAVVGGRPPVVGGDYGHDVLVALEQVLAIVNRPGATTLNTRRACP
jgi:predicted dehydrogenase